MTNLLGLGITKAVRPSDVQSYGQWTRQNAQGEGMAQAVRQQAGTLWMTDGIGSAGCQVAG